MENELLEKLLKLSEENGALKKENEILKMEIQKLNKKYEKYKIGERLFGK
ncbi:hypothetical protein OD350_24765 [Clostridium beijerinckii]|uniref:Cell division protein FtsB n=1 Tax=Clostridium beijerinckii TaxID=1520 RepID=A0AAX0B4Y4_CLOBE|nr:hypothetical protein [Clostridium beijerinckii]NRT90211.1 cell division protein FtsB [Clostridium beijerinckii]NYC69741.1 cell division protein FtsB [Clostridium beijerinckii]UYZ35384.1 hypothetical protein OD350_24765 [Clostridium beijerinckii]